MKRKIYKLLSSAKQLLFALALTTFSGAVYSQTTYTFNYTGSQQTISLPAGTYTLETWGANGGNNLGNGSTTYSQNGGRGAYSMRTYTLASAAIIYVNVGGLGSNSTSSLNVVAPGGYNGGGYGSANSASGKSSGAGGGGASHLATASGTLGALASNTAAVLIVAGGGGGAGESNYVNTSTAYNSNGGNGGGTAGFQNVTSSYQGRHGQGGTQVAGGGGGDNGSAVAGVPLQGIFGAGGYNTTTNGNTSAGGSGAGGGGGGWYGGGAGWVGSTGFQAGSGGGGSGYIAGVANATTIAFGQSGFVTNPDASGNGMVLIKELCSISLSASGSNSTAPSICSGQSVTLTTNAVSNYSWSTGNTTSSVIVVSPATTSVYALSAMSASNCMASRSITVTVSAGLPVLTITNTPNTICLGKTATLTAGGALTYTWSGGSVPVVNGQSFLPTATTVYTVSGQNGCGISTSTTAITIAPLVVTASASPSLVCAGNPATLTAVSSVNGYTWTPSNSVINPAVVGPTVNTIYTVAASDGTCFGTATVAVNTKPNPTITIASSSSVVCEGAAVTMTASGGITYVWNPGNTTNAVLSDNPIAPTLYQVVGTSSNGCTSQASQIVLTNTAPLVMVSSNKTIVCSGDPAILTASGATAYNWTNGPSTAVNQVNPTTPTVYTVSGVGSNSCTATKTIAVNVLAANVSATSATSSICNGGSTTLTASGANTYVWVGTPSFNGVAIVSPSVTTNYSVNANTTITGLSCPSSTTISVTVFNNPTVSILATKTVVCKSDPAITLTGTGAVTYTWSTNATSLAISIKPQVTTTYTVGGTDANGCQNTASIQIKVNTCTSVGELSGSEKGLMVYPNPSNGVFEVRSETDLDLKLINDLGQEIRSFSLNAQNDHTLHVNDLANGVYFIVGQNESVKMNQKIIIAK